MPIKQSAKKYLRASKKRALENLKIKKNFKEAVKKVQELVKESKSEEARKAFQLAQKTLDKAAKVGVIKKNTASRKKSRLAKMIKKASK